MRYLFIFTALLFLLSSCKKNDIELYSDQTSIYFEGERDIEFTFSKYKEDEITILIPLEISGYKSSTGREFNLQVIKDSTTAVEGTHYKILMDKMEMAADSFKINVPVKLFNTDPTLKSEKVRLYLRILPGGEFPKPFYQKQNLSLYISDILIKPKLWDSFYSGFFGIYSETKHRKILEVCDISEIPDERDGGPFNYKWDAFGRAVNNYYKEFYPQYDENNQVIEPWM